MRFLLPCASVASALVLLAGCSDSTPGNAALPTSASASHSIPLSTSPATAHGSGWYPLLLKKQIDGRLRHYLPLRVLELEYHAWQKRGSSPKIQHVAKPVAIWTASQPAHYLLGTAIGGEVIDARDLLGCVPSTVKVDHSQNVWVNCSAGSASQALGGAYEERGPTGKLITSYTWNPPLLQCPPSAASCFALSAYGLDGVANGSYVFEAVESAQTGWCPMSNPNCGGEYNIITGTGYEWWPQGQPSAQPTFVNLANCCGSAIQSVGYMDVDGNGNLLFDYANFSCSSGMTHYGVGEIINPASNSWSFVDLIPATCSGSLTSAAGLYVSHSGSVSNLNITDPQSRRIYSYVLPITSSSNYTTLGPTPQNRLHGGAPLSGGFGANDQYVVQGDAAGWLDLGTVATNKWKVLSNFNLGGVQAGAALTPSDR